MSGDYSGEEFVGYLFRGSPERRPRLWFLDRHLVILRDTCGWTVSGPEATWGQLNIDVGTWSMGDARNDIGVAGLTVRYDHHSSPPWSAVWRLTDTTIPQNPADAAHGFGIHNFGRDDDVWRLGVWPD